jgi:hypothetical protein
MWIHKSHITRHHSVIYTKIFFVLNIQERHQVGVAKPLFCRVLVMSAFIQCVIYIVLEQLASASSNMMARSLIPTALIPRYDLFILLKYKSFIVFFTNRITNFFNSLLFKLFAFSIFSLIRITYNYKTQSMTLTATPHL